MTLEQFQQVNARLREYFDPLELPEWWGSRQPLLDGRFAIDCSYHEVMRLIDLSRFTPGLSLRSRHLKDQIDAGAGVVSGFAHVPDERLTGALTPTRPRRSSTAMPLNE